MRTLFQTFLAGFIILPPPLFAAAPRDYPIQPVPFTRIQITDSFWKPRLDTNRQTTVWYDFQKCEETGRIENFEVAGGLKEGGFQGIYFNDSDVFKVIEGASYMIKLQPDAKLKRYLDDLIAKIAAAQEEDGYLYTARTINDPDYNYPGKEGGRWSHLAHGHELYNVGHMYEAAVAHWQSTGQRNFLDVAVRNADLVCRVFGPGPGQRIDVPGHEEIEIGLVKLYRATGREKYLRQAKFFIDVRGRKDLRKNIYGSYCQDHKPLEEQEEAVGHAVRGGYLYAGVADVAAMTGDKNYIRAIDGIWEDVVNRKLYLTGNVGQHGAGEGYAGAYQLTNVRAYNETCAAIALALWNHRMFLLHGDAKYIDVLERIIYNGFLAGVSLSGDRFFYPNPLACDMKFKFNHGALERSPWFDCSCCPVNVVRFVPAIAGYIYAVREDSVYANLYVGGTGDVSLGDQTVKITQQTDYPWKGAVRLEVAPEKPTVFTLRLRIPGWARNQPLPGNLYRYVEKASSKFAVTVNGSRVDPKLEHGYAVVKRTWEAGDVVELTLPMEARRVLSHEKVTPNKGRVAVERGPIVYCIEGADHGGEVDHLYLPDEAVLIAQPRPELLGGVVTLQTRGRAAHRTKDRTVRSKKVPLTMIPYYAWCHRGPNEMQVWMARNMETARVAPRPTLASQSRVSASHCWSLDTVEAVRDQIEPQDSGDHNLPRLTWWDHRGGTEWVQYEFAQATKVSKVEIYWFDDSGRGQCRAPRSWRLLYRDGGQWKPVQNQGEFGVRPDRFNAVVFEPVMANALRVEVALQDGFSGGILEWKVE